MKQIIILMGLLLIGYNPYAQDNLEKRLSAVENGDSVTTNEPDINVELKVNVNQEIVTKSKGNADTTIIRLGKRNVVVIGKEDGTTTVEIPERKTYTEYKKVPKFKGHWAGFEWGFNGYLTPSHSAVMDGDLKFMEMKQGRSWNINLNFFQQSIGFGTDKIGLVTGLGLEFNDYHFRNKTNFKVQNGITVVDSSNILSGYKVTKSKFSTQQLVVPLLLEFQIPISGDSHRLFFSTGVIGGVRIGSHTKVEYEHNGEKKDKVKDDFNMFSFRYGLTARIGYRGLKLFANYYPTPLFEKGKGPEVYPFSVGLILLSFN
jgi:hypothetical protein